MKQTNKSLLAIAFFISPLLFFSAECNHEEPIGACTSGIKVSIDNPSPAYVKGDARAVLIDTKLKADDTLWHTFYYEDAWLYNITAYQGGDTILYRFTGGDERLLSISSYTPTGKDVIKYTDKNHEFSKFPYRLELEDFLVIDRLERYSTKFKWRKNPTDKERQILFGIQSGDCSGDVIVTQEANPNPNPTTP